MCVSPLEPLPLTMCVSPLEPLPFEHVHVPPSTAPSNMCFPHVRPLETLLAAHPCCSALRWLFPERGCQSAAGCRRRRRRGCRGDVTRSLAARRCRPGCTARQRLRCNATLV
eukprot:357053-Chlamydomonas_euryale.AAC.3